MLESLSLVSEQSLNVELSDLLAEIETELGGSLLDIAILIELNKLLALSDLDEGLNEVLVVGGLLDNVSDLGDVSGASLTLLGDDNIRSLLGAVVDPLQGVDLDEEEVGVEGLVILSRVSNVISGEVLGSEGRVDQMVNKDLVVGAVLVGGEALVGNFVQLSTEVVEDGAGNVGVLNVSKESSSESLDGSVDSSSAIGVVVGVVGGPDGVGPVKLGVEVAVIDELLDVESDDTPPVREGLSVRGDESGVEESLTESRSEGFALFSSLEALGLVEKRGHVLREGLEISETLSLREVVSGGIDLEVADLGDVLVETGILKVLNSHVRDELPELNEDVSVVLLAENEISDVDEEDSGGVGEGVEANSLVGSVEHGGERSEEEEVVVLVESGDVDLVDGGQESVESLSRLSAGGSVELLSLNDVRVGGVSESASVEEEESHML